MQSLRHCQIGIEPLHITARHHHRDKGTVIEVEHVLHHLVLMVLNDAGIPAFVKAGHNLFFGHRPV